MALKHLYLIAVAAALACAPGPGTSGAPAPRASVYLAAAEIRDANVEIGSAYDAIARLRPNWLTHVTETFGNPPTREFARVFVDGRLYGELESLRSFEASQIAGARYYSAAESGKFGLQGGLSGVIEITTKK
jgi:hypothetical protein